MNRLFDLDHPFFIPLWRRIAIVVLCIGWAIFELVGGNVFWAMAFGAIGYYAGWHFFFNFNPRTPEK